MKLGTLKYNRRTEQGEVHIDWEAMPSGVVGLDILQDWAYTLMEEYRTARDKEFSRFSSFRPSTEK